MKLIIVSLTLFVLTQSNPRPDRPTLESKPVQEIKLERDSNLGWFGLLGLFGIFGLTALHGKRYEDPVRYCETDEENYFG